VKERDLLVLTNATETSQQGEQNMPGNRQIPPPTLSVPKGGGAIRGIGEKFAAHPLTGTGSMTVPILTSPGRSGFGPQLALSYDSGAGNGPFGFGWQLPHPAITRKTEKGLPLYLDGEESDVFLLAGAEDLVPLLARVGNQWQRQPDTRTLNGVTYRIQPYRPRIEGLFSRIERWTDMQTGEIHWRSLSKDNVTSLYGQDNSSRIFDPAETAESGPPQRIFSWFITASYDDRGNALVYEYKAENSQNVDVTQANERNRTTLSRSANRYLKRIRYGNLSSQLVQPDLSQMNWLFEVVFDYGEHDASLPTPAEVQPWLCRHDPFSSQRSSFEVRSYRLCQRILLFHHFPAEPTAGQDCLVHSTDLIYQNTRQNPEDLQRGNPLASFLASITRHGYVRQPDSSYHKKALPALQFTYSQAVIQSEVKELDAGSLQNLPAGLDGQLYRWLDLDGEGVSGILTEQASAWLYKPNLGDGQFGPQEVVARQPASAALSGGRQQLLSLAGDGRLDLVDFSGPLPGFFKRTQEQGWEPFAAFASLPEIDWQDGNLRLVDVDGDGLTDILITEHDALRWHQSLAEKGFGPAQSVSKPFDEELGPRLVFADGTQSIYLADMSGDGLSDLVRVRNGEVCYWPNQGYGHFGLRVSMDNAPWFTSLELFDEQRVRLADIDGSGTTDLIYLGTDTIQIYFNQAGNTWSEPHTLSPLPHLDRLSSVMTVDLLGNGTVCLVWSSPLPAETRQPLRYIDLMGGQKPHLLLSINNNLGTSTTIGYASSTRFFLTDKLAGQPWITRLAFPVQVVERVEIDDRISGNRFVTRYAYHHGHYDSAEREFRGFGMIEEWDTQELAALTASGTLPAPTNIDATSYVPPVCTRSWFHTGVFLDQQHISRLFERDYYREGDDSALAAILLDDSILPSSIRLPAQAPLPYDLSGDEAQEACRALKGSLLRQEIYALDGSEAQDRPYRVLEHNYTLELLQPQGPNRHAVFLTHAREMLDCDYERALFPVQGQTLADPRVSHTLTLAVDDFGNPFQSVAIAYGRRYDDPDPRLTDEDRQRQKRLLLTLSTHQYTNPILQDDAYRAPLPCETRSYELRNITADSAQPRVTNLFRFDELAAKVLAASDGQHDLPYEDFDAAGALTSEPYRRLLEWNRSLYRRDDLSTALPFSQVQARAAPFESYRLAFTPGLLATVYQRTQGTVTETLLPAPPSVLGQEGGYVRSNELKADGRFPATDPDDHWWIPSGQVFYSPASNDSAVRELSYASEHFFLARRYRDPFADTTTVTYDTYNLLLQETQDSLGNRTTAGTRDTNGLLINSSNDYRVLHPTLVMDVNRNRVAVAFDALGMVVGTAVMGKPEESLGDSLDGFVADLSDAVVAAHLQDPLNDPTGPLQQATTRLIYDFFAYQRTHNAAQPQPPVVYTILRETHNADLEPGQQSRVQHHFTYADGFGRQIQQKIQAEPGPLVDGGAISDMRWVGSGWTIYNNKGQPVRIYEPFFSATHQFELALTAGVSPILFYDPCERVVATLHPNHTYEKVVFDPWKQATWDVGDTVLLSPQTDADVGGFFQRLPDADYQPIWYDQRQGGMLGPEEQTNAQKSALCAHTPTLAHLDTLGHTFLTIAHNHFIRHHAPINEFYASRRLLDIQGNQRALRDARGRVVMRDDYDLLARPLHQASMEAGERWLLHAVDGKPLRAWDSRKHLLRTTYDVLRRPLRRYLSIDGGAEVLVGQTIYGETQATPEAYNMRGKPAQVFDEAGIVSSGAFDFKGNLLSGSRQLAAAYTTLLDWSMAVTLEAEVYTSSSTYDALNRPLTQTLPDASVLQRSYNQANLLTQVSANLRGSAATTSYISRIDYNARGQRSLIAYGNGVQTRYRYDPQTFRMTGLYTTRGAAFPGDGTDPTMPPVGVQNLHYIYDPCGNITFVRDNARQTVYFRNRLVEPSAEYTYDALSRLLSASGREHLGQIAGAGPQVPLPLTPDDGPRSGQMHPGDGNAMGTYLQEYRYDEVGNILQMLHQGSDPAQPGWTRTYTYSEPSLLETGKVSNRLSSTQPGSDPPETYTYDVHGNMTRMSHLPLMQWDYKEQLQATTQQIVHNGGLPETTIYRYDANGQRIRKVTERQAAPGQTPTRLKERLYLGGLEIYREYGGDGHSITLERQTLLIVDDKQCVALVETRTQGSDHAAGQLTRYQFSNQLDTACLELDDQGQIITYEEYYPFGSSAYQAVRSQTETPKRYRFTGKERDEENALYYHGARYYACWLGRWTAPDPQGLIDGNNLYRYVHNNPVRHSDPTGTLSWGQWAGLGVALVVGTVVTVATAGLAGPVVGAVAAGIIGGAVGGGLGSMAGEAIEAHIDHREAHLGQAFVVGAVTGAALAGLGAAASAGLRTAAGQALTSRLAATAVGRIATAVSQRVGQSVIGRGAARASAFLREPAERLGQSIAQRIPGSASNRVAASAIARAEATQLNARSVQGVTRSLTSATEGQTFTHTPGAGSRLGPGVSGAKIEAQGALRLSPGGETGQWGEGAYAYHGPVADNPGGPSLQFAVPPQTAVETVTIPGQKPIVRLVPPPGNETVPIKVTGNDFPPGTPGGPPGVPARSLQAGRTVMRDMGITPPRQRFSYPGVSPDVTGLSGGAGRIGPIFVGPTQPHDDRSPHVPAVGVHF
jgi:RHS repeat-associated protein